MVTVMLQKSLGLNLLPATVIDEGKQTQGAYAVLRCLLVCTHACLAQQSLSSVQHS